MAHQIETCFIQDQTQERTNARRAGMIAGTDSWHTLGVAIDYDCTMTVDDIKEKAGFNGKKLVKIPCSYTHPTTGVWTPSGQWDATKNQYVGGRCEVVRLDDNRSRGNVSDGYCLLQYEDTVEPARPWIETGLAIPHTGGILDDGKVSFLTCKPKVDPIDVLPGDPIELFWTTIAGHVGNMAVNMGFSHIRTVCMNTAKAAMKEMANGGAEDDEAKGVSIVHKRYCKEGIMAAAKSLDFARREFIASAEEMRAMARFGVSAKDMERFFRLVSGTKDLDIERSKLHGISRRPLEQMEEALALAPGASVASGTLYSLINAVTYWNTYTRGTRATTADSRTMSLWTNTGRKSNDTAWKLATAWMKNGNLQAV